MVTGKNGSPWAVVLGWIYMFSTLTSLVLLVLTFVLHSSISGILFAIALVIGIINIIGGRFYSRWFRLNGRRGHM